MYTLAEMFVYPSMYEGFGLPVVEAMACGVPVITGRAAALAEVGGGAVEHVDELDADALGDALVALARRAASGARTCRRAASRARRCSRGSARRARAWRSTATPWRGRAAAPRARSPAARSAPAAAATAAAAHVDRRAVRPGVLPALRSEAVGGAAAVCAARRAVRGGLRPRSAATASRCSTRCSPSRRTSGRAALDRHRPRFAVIYEDNFNYLSKMCLLRMREAALAMIDAARGARHHRRSSPAPMPPITRRRISTAAPTS